MFQENKTMIENACQRLEHMPVEKALMGALVLAGLRRVLETAEELDGLRADDLPFANHFFNELATLPHDDESHWWNLLEDLAVMFRALSLAAPDRPVPESERALLDFFERSPEWRDGTLIADWYWRQLPARFAS